MPTPYLSKADKSPPKWPTPAADDLVLVNCARCGVDLYGESMAGVVPAKHRGLRHVAGRVAERPYCGRCLPRITPEGR